MSEKQRDDFLRSIVDTGAHVDAAELDLHGRGRIEFYSDDMEIAEIRELKKWLEHQPSIGDVRISLAPDP